MSNEESRKAFEVFAITVYKNISFEKDDGEYRYSLADVGWKYWQASRDFANKIKQAQTVEPIANLRRWLSDPELGPPERVIYAVKVLDAGRALPMGEYDLYLHPAAPPSKSFSATYPPNPAAICDCEHWQSCAECHPTAHQAPPTATTIKQPLSTERAGLIAWQHDLVKKYISLGYEGLAEMCKQTADMLEADDQEMSNLLARIHRDGGHYEAEHGRHKSVIAADLIVAKLNALSDAQQVAVPMTIADVEQMLGQWDYEIHGDRARYIVRMTEQAHGITPQGDKT